MAGETARPRDSAPCPDRLGRIRRRLQREEAAAAGAAYVAAGFQAPPSIALNRPGEFASATVPIEFDVTSATPAEVHIAFEQNGVRTELPDPPSGATTVKTAARAATAPGFKILAGPATVLVTASRKVWGIRTLRAEASKAVTIRLEKPRVSVVSTKHYIYLGGSEMIVYRATPEDVSSGVRVGDLEYPGFPLAADPTIVVVPRVGSTVMSEERYW